MVNYYEILGISPDATPRQIRDAYIKLAKRVHPDHNNQNDRRMIELNNIYEVLSNNAKRRVYDERFIKDKVYDFTVPKQEENPDIREEQPLASENKFNPLKILRLCLTGFLICLVVYLVFYLAVNILNFVTELPGWLLRLAPTTI